MSFFFQAEDGIRDQPRSRGLGDVYKRQISGCCMNLFMSFTDQVISGSGIWFFIISNWSEEVASQSVIKW